jgi:hypothetical protein
MKTRKTSIQQIKFLLLAVIFLFFSLSKVSGQIPIYSPDKNQELLNEPFDISGDFRNFTNTYYLADSLSSFDPKTGKGEITYRRYENVTREAFNNMMGVLKPVEPNEFPTGEYAGSPSLPFSIEFISPRTIRIRASSRFQVKPDKESLMLINGKPPHDNSSWQYNKIDGGYSYSGPYGSVIPRIALAQSTAQMDWSKLDLVVYATDSQKAIGQVCLPTDKVLHKISLVRKGGTFVLETDPYAAKVGWTIRMYSK